MTTQNVAMEDRYGKTILIQYTVNSDGSLSPTGGGAGNGSGGVSASTSATVWIDPTSGTPVYYVRIENNDGNGNLTVAWTTPAGVTATPTIANLVPYEVYSLGNQQDASASSDGGTFSLIALTKRLLAKLTSGIGVTGTFWQATQPVSAASLPLPAGASTSANQTSVIGSAGAGTAAASSELTGGLYNTALPTLANGQQSAIQLDGSGRQISVLQGTLPAFAATPAVAPSNKPVGAANINTNQVSVTSSAALAVAARTGGVGTGRVDVTLYNSGSSTVWIGNSSSVTTTTGIRILPGGSPTVDTSSAIYAITATGTTSSLDYLETY